MKSEPESLRFTIITSTFNAAELLPVTARSIESQTYRNFQWIVIDGASTDDTVAVARGFGHLLDVLISEKDTGIYSAWNKALPHIRGEWVIFLGAGDSLFDCEVLGQVSSELTRVEETATTVYGNVLYVHDGSDEGVRLRNDVWMGLEGPWVGGRPAIPCHQGVFQRASLFHDGFKFDARCKISADNEILLREFIQGHGHKIDLVISRFHAGGISAQRNRRLRMVAESIFINRKLGIFWERPMYQLYMLTANSLRHIYCMLQGQVSPRRTVGTASVDAKSRDLPTK